MYCPTNVASVRNRSSENVELSVLGPYKFTKYTFFENTRPWTIKYLHFSVLYFSLEKGLIYELESLHLSSWVRMM